MNNYKTFPGVKAGDTFTVAGIEFFRFREKDGKVAVTTVQPLFHAPIGDCADLKKSGILRRLNEEFLPKIVEQLGKENVCTFKTDLMTLDGVKTYGAVEGKICLPNLSFYQENVDIYDLHKTDTWWWLATAWSAAPHYNSALLLCVAPSGSFGDDICIHGGGVRPVLIFESSIFGSSGEEIA